jgi:hypothetical protein
MRTKTLLAITAVGVAGIATSMAQVFSVNAVGYVNKTVPANSFAMLSNPLKAATNTINALFTGVPAGFAVYVYTPGKGYDIAQYDDLDGKFLPDAVANMELLPGQGVFVKNPSANPVTITFVGEVMQGHLVTDLVPGFQIVSSTPAGRHRYGLGSGRQARRHALSIRCNHQTILGEPVR